MPTPETTAQGAARPPLTAPVIDCEPPALPLGHGEPARPPTCPAPSVRHRHTPRRLRLVEEPPERQLHAGAAQFADLALRRVLEVVDRRRPPAHLKALMSPLLLDAIVAAAKSSHGPTASLRRVGLRPAASPGAVEVFATYTRGARIRAVAGRIELRSGRWQLTALQLG
ncbi:Rv3235 family protein [Mycolicibacterium sp. HK-90]|uniref:Rv3235 family protein n=1 Tax=Mycolicibacterium sp. HK-90 TaxID=3056937 RepID=UPI00265853E6|nr:Rv3235 family protein [Mycolicibacterium sp. HK-90]WKG05224.1 Rv3235 family protein [Mycolicibacterium sp. HK-90]